MEIIIFMYKKCNCSQAESKSLSCAQQTRLLCTNKHMVCMPVLGRFCTLVFSMMYILFRGKQSKALSQLLANIIYRANILPTQQLTTCRMPTKLLLLGSSVLCVLCDPSITQYLKLTSESREGLFHGSYHFIHTQIYLFW